MQTSLAVIADTQRTGAWREGEGHRQHVVTEEVEGANDCWGASVDLYGFYDRGGTIREEDLPGTPWQRRENAVEALGGMLLPKSEWWRLLQRFGLLGPKIRASGTQVAGDGGGTGEYAAIFLDDQFEVFG
jgi:hypothetical protein